MKIHMVGVGGISMRALARYLVDAGHEVTGCDVNSLTQIGYPEDPDQAVVRSALGFPITRGHDRSHVEGCDQVVINSAITESHPGWPEVVMAHKQAIPVLKRAEKIGEITRERTTIAITGTHGKSTTTGMAAKLALAAELDPFVMIGAPVADFDNQTYRRGNGPLVLEADEFDRSFLQFTVQIGVVNNIEADHLDYYTGGLPEIITTFAEFMKRVVPGGTLILNSDDPNVLEAFRQAEPTLAGRRIVRFGRAAGADYRIMDGVSQPHMNRFTLTPARGETINLKLKVPGNYNQENATAILAVGDSLGIPRATSIAALEAYTGVGYRFQTLADIHGARIILDYGHHPTEVRVTIDAARAWFGDEPLTVVFQPHQYARTKLLFADFVEALGHAAKVYVTDIYGVVGREDGNGVSSQTLVESLVAGDVDATYLPVAEMVPTIRDLADRGGIFLMMGAGLDIREAAYAVAHGLHGRID